MNPDQIPTCDLCGVFLHVPHTVTVTIDGRKLAHLQVCVRHRERLQDVVEDTIRAETQARRAA